LALQPAAFLGEALTPLGQLRQAHRAGFVGVQQPLVGPCAPLQPGAELLLGHAVAGGAGLPCGGEAVELREQLLRVGQQGGDVVPHGGLEVLGLDAAARADRGAGTQDAVLATALIVLPLWLVGARGTGDAVHGQAAGLAGEQAAQQVVVPAVVAERERGVARQLRLRPVPGLGVDQRRDRDGDPLLARLQAAAGRLAGARATSDPWLGRRDVGVAVGVGGAGVDRVGEDVVHRRGRPGMAAGARQVGAGIQPLEDLADGHPLLRQPAVEGARQLRLGLIDHEMAGDRIAARHVAIAVRGAAAEVVPVARPLQLAAAEALAENGALVFGDGALDLQQQLIVRVIRDRVVQERHLAAGPAELLQEQDLVGVAPRQAIGAQHRDEPDGAVADGVAQRVEAGSVEAAAAVALVAEDVLLGELMAVGGGPSAQGGELAVDRLLALLALGRDAGVEGGAHGGVTSARRCGRAGAAAGHRCRSTVGGSPSRRR
jgi:hypothetical protein